MTMLRAGGLLDVLIPLSDCRQESVEKRQDGTENFGGFAYVLDGFPQRDFVLWVFMCPINISLFCVSFVCLFCLFFSLFSGYHAEGYHAPSIPHGLSRLYHHCTATTLVSFPATTPRATTPHLYRTGYHAFTTTARLPRFVSFPATTP